MEKSPLNVKWEIFLICYFCFLSYLFIAYLGCIVLEEYQEHFSFEVTEVQIVTVKKFRSNLIAYFSFYQVLFHVTLSAKDRTRAY